MYHFFAEPKDITEGNIRIGGSDYNHIKNVLRINKNELVSIYDGQYNEYICSLNRYENEYVFFNIINKLKAESELSSKIYLFQGLPKSDKMEMIIQKAVELGVYKIIPVAMRRSVVKYDRKKQISKLERWNSISVSAAKQSARAVIPIVDEIMNYESALDIAASLDKVFIPYEHEAGMNKTRELLNELKSGESIGIFIGPEGGFDDIEIQEALEKNYNTISLGRRILRTETAGLCALSVLMFAMEK